MKTKAEIAANRDMRVRLRQADAMWLVVKTDHDYPFDSEYIRAYDVNLLVALVHRGIGTLTIKPNQNGHDIAEVTIDPTGKE